MRYSLNTTFEEWSAGTEVEIIHFEVSSQMATVRPFIHPDVEFDIPMELLTKRRNRTDEIFVPTREVRRRGLDRRNDV